MPRPRTRRPISLTSVATARWPGTPVPVATWSTTPWVRRACFGEMTNNRAWLAITAAPTLVRRLPTCLRNSHKIGHPFPSGTNTHDRTESEVLNNNRHATCVDCHNPHASSPVSSFAAPPAIRPSQNSVVGISASDSLTVLKPAINQYENCLRCHGASVGKTTDKKYGYLPVWAASAGDPLNIIPQFAATSSSSHPVTHDRSSALPQPSLRAQMLNLDGTTPGRNMGVRILCTDCHNSDDNREFGGTGANGPARTKFFICSSATMSSARRPPPVSQS